MQRGEFELLASQIVEQYADEEAKKSYIRMARKRHGGGCGCGQCIKNAVLDWNSWVDWIFEGNDAGEAYRASVVISRGRLGIALGYDLEERERRKHELGDSTDSNGGTGDDTLAA